MAVDLDVLRNATEELLCSRGVLDVDTYGWLNENDEDPEFIGYAMWARNPPYEHDFNGWQNHTPPGRAPTEAEQRLMELGHDFFGLMKTARHFIGHTLLHQPALPSLDIEPTGFDFNWFGALVALTVAGDRLRDFIIVTMRKANKQCKRDNVCDRLRESGLGNEAHALKEGFEAIDKVTKARNEVVHELATLPAHVERLLIASEREASDEHRGHAPGNRETPYEDVIRKDEELSDVEARANLLCDCYVNLIKMGDSSFRIENALRQRQQS